MPEAQNSKNRLPAFTGKERRLFLASLTGIQGGEFGEERTGQGRGEETVLPVATPGKERNGPLLLRKGWAVPRGDAHSHPFLLALPALSSCCQAFHFRSESAPHGGRALHSFLPHCPSQRFTHPPPSPVPESRGLGVLIASVFFLFVCFF